MDKGFEHSKLPWSFEKERNVIFATHGEDDHIGVAKLSMPWCEESAKDGEFIVKAVNNHEALKNTLELLMFDILHYEECNKVKAVSNDTRSKVNNLLNSLVERIDP